MPRGEISSGDTESRKLTSVDQRGRSALIAFLAVLVVVLYGVSVWYAYDLGLRRGSAQSIPLVKANPSPTKVAPDDPGGIEVPHQDKLVYGVLDNTAIEEEVELLMPPPEEPRPLSDSAPALIKETHEVYESSEDVKTSHISDESNELSSAQLDDEGKATPSASNQTQQSGHVSSQDATEPTGEGLEHTADARGKEVSDNEIDMADVESVTRYRIQIASLRDRTGAERAWKLALAANSDLLSELIHNVERVDLGEARGVYYRLQVGYFVDSGSAESLCKRLRARSQACLVVSP